MEYKKSYWKKMSKTYGLLFVVGFLIASFLSNTTNVNNGAIFLIIPAIPLIIMTYSIVKMFWSEEIE